MYTRTMIGLIFGLAAQMPNSSVYPRAVHIVPEWARSDAK